MIFRISRTYKFFYILIFLGTLSVGSSLLLRALSRNSGLVPVILAMILFSIAVYFGLEALRLCLTIDERSLSLQRAFSSRAILLDDIWGYTTDEEETIFYLIMKNGEKPLLIPNKLQRREELIKWVKRTYRDADKVQFEEEEERMLKDEEFGPTRESREVKLKRARKVSFAANVVSFVLLFWAIIYPQNSGIVLSLLAPWLALFLTAGSGGLIKLRTAKSSPYPTVLTLFLLPAFGAAVGVLRLYRPYHFPRSAAELLLKCTLLMTALAVLVLAKTILRERRKTGILLGFFVVAALYSWGLLYYSNCRYDDSAPQIGRALVSGKSANTGRTSRWVNFYYLYVSSPKYFTGTKKLEVSESLYTSVSARDSVSVYLRPGRWDISWYQVAKQ